MKKTQNIKKQANERGQSLGEVALFLALVVVVAIVALTNLGQSIVDILNQVANAI
jgi:Flp pilus assembly pilin Flp